MDWRNFNWVCDNLQQKNLTRATPQNESNCLPLGNYVKANFKAYDKIYEFFQERYQCEQEYLKHFHKVNKKLTSISEMDIEKKLCESIRQQMDEESTIYLGNIAEYKKILEQLSNESREMKKTFKNTQSEIQKRIKHLANLNAAFNKAKNKYEKVCGECDQLQNKLKSANLSQNPPVEQKAIDKLKSQIKKNSKTQLSAQQDYSNSVQSLKTYIPNYDAGMKVDVEEYVDILQKIRDSIRRAVRHYVEIIELSSKSLGAGCQIVVDASKFMETDNVHERWIESNITTGLKIEIPTVKICESKIFENEENTNSSVRSKEIVHSPRSNQDLMPNGKAGYVAGWSYEAVEDDELSFNAGDMIHLVSKREDGWWEVVNNEGHTGLVPGNYFLDP